MAETTPDAGRGMRARVVLSYFSVFCPQCGEPLPAPYSLIGWYLWTPDEVREARQVYCQVCDTTSDMGEPAKDGD